MQGHPSAPVGQPAPSLASAEASVVLPLVVEPLALVSEPSAGGEPSAVSVSVALCVVESTAPVVPYGPVGSYGSTSPQAPRRSMMTEAVRRWITASKPSIVDLGTPDGAPCPGDRGSGGPFVAWQADSCALCSRVGGMSNASCGLIARPTGENVACNSKAG